MSHTPWVSSDAWGIFYLLKMSGSDKRFFVKKNNEQKCRATFDEKRPSGLKRKSPDFSGISEYDISGYTCNQFLPYYKVTENVMSVMTYAMIEKMTFETGIFPII